MQNAPKGSILQYFDLLLPYNCHSDHCFVYFEWPFYTGFIVFLFIAEGELDGNCLTGVDSCNDPNAMCVENTCVCNSNYYDSDGIPNNNAGFCTLSK